MLFLTTKEVEPGFVTVQVMARAEGEGVVGDMRELVLPGATFMGLTHATLLAAGEGAHEHANLLAKQNDAAAPSSPSADPQ